MMSVARRERPRELYNRSVARWVRKEPVVLSDFTARPQVLELCEPVKGLEILDLGCGEGYCSRELKRRGAGRVLGIDISDEMIAAACYEEKETPLGIQYARGTADDLSEVPDGSFDSCLAMFLYNYMSTERMKQSMAEVRRVLKPGGRFVFSVPHPAFSFIWNGGAPFHFDTMSAGYFSGRDTRFNGVIHRRDGVALDVHMVHKTVQDYFEGLKAVGFNSMPSVRELRVEHSHLALDPVFFGPVADLPLHMAFGVER